MRHRDAIVNYGDRQFVPGAGSEEPESDVPGAAGLIDPLSAGVACVTRCATRSSSVLPGRTLRGLRYRTIHHDGM
ncbi:MAG: hypothetical protein P8L30_12945 [Longimicrobiales bacterium]|nr:hypothetical protein [Longimicrobiales bacterium]